MRFKITFLPVLLIVILIAGCGGGTKTDPDHRYWTILVYMCAANNLEYYAIQNMNQMEQVGSNGNMAVVTQVKRIAGYDTSNGNWTSTRRYYVTKDNDTSIINSTLLEDMGQSIDMASPDTLADFISWGKAAYPADHYALVIWNHGEGWYTSRAVAPPPIIKAVCLDEVTGEEMSLAELTQAFTQGGSVDVTAFDACLMEMIEVAYSIKDYSHVMVGAEDNILADGLPYERILASVESNPTVGADGFSGYIVDAYQADHASDIGGFNLSAVDLTLLDDVVTASDQLASAIIANISTIRQDVRNAQAATQSFDFTISPNPDDIYRDLYDFADKLGGIAEIQNERTAVMNSVSDAVIHEWHKGSYLADSHGISIYLPGPGDMLSQYETISFSDATHWDEFLAAY